MKREDEIPPVLGDYQLIERIGYGGMASLYLARRAGARGFVRPVAMKVVHPHLSADPDFVEMFIDEANVCSRLSHPNIVHVEQLGEVDGQLFLVMEFVEGVPMSLAYKYARATKQPLPFELVVNMVMQIADGLHSAHETRGDANEPLQIVHRDVSPSNVLLSKQGHAKIIDFGIAKFSTRVHQTRAKKLKGKVAYMAPEQLHRGPVDRRGDIYSLGMVLWEGLANQRAYRAKDEVELLQMVLTQPLPNLEELRPNLPKDLLAVVQGALARDVLDRFETAHEFSRALGDAVPAATRVPPEKVGALVNRVLAHRGDLSSSFQRIRSGSDTMITPTITPTQGAGLSLPGRVLSDHEIAVNTLTPLSPSQQRASERPAAEPIAEPSNNRKFLWLGFAAAVLIGMFFAYQWGNESAEQSRQDRVAKVIEPRETGRVVDDNEAADDSVAKDTPEAASPKTASPKTNTDERADVAENVEAIRTEKTIEPDPPKRPSVRRTAKRRSRRVKATAAATPKKAKRRVRETPEEPEAVVEIDAADDQELSVGGVRLASPDDVDRANAQGQGRRKATKVEQDDTLLADDYQ